MDRKGIIFDIKKFAIHDGPGIRSSVFFKGCPLRCLWCHNPEGISPRREIMVFAGRCLKGCRDCLAACPHQALDKRRGAIILDRSRCDGCGACAEVCPAEALQATGREMSVAKSWTNCPRTTPSTGNRAAAPLSRAASPCTSPLFCARSCTACRGEKIHTAVDTSGHAPFSAFASILPLADLFLFDLKIMDDACHQRLTGVSNRLLLDNLQKLSGAGRASLRPHTAGPRRQRRDRDLEQAADFCAALPGRHPVHLLPYHRGYVGKLMRLGRAAPLAATQPPDCGGRGPGPGIFSLARESDRHHRRLT